jgi:hypothetical protein
MNNNSLKNILNDKIMKYKYNIPKKNKINIKLFNYKIKSNPYEYKKYNKKYTISFEKYIEKSNELDFWYDIGKNTFDNYNALMYTMSDIEINTKKYMFQIFNLDTFLYVLKKVMIIYEKMYNYEYKWQNAKPIFDKDDYIIQKIYLEPNCKIIFIGDTHSSFHGLIYILKQLENDGLMKKNELILEKNVNIFFTGDYVDYGPYGIEVIVLLFTLFINNPNKCHILRGNHEDKNMNENQNNIFTMSYGFYLELIEQFNLRYESKEILKIFKIYNYLPSLIFLNYNKKLYHISHGTIDVEYCGLMTYCLSHGKTIDDITKSQMYKFLTSYDKMFDIIDKNIYNTTDLLWGDFDNTNKFCNFSNSSSRNSYGYKIINKYLRSFNIEYIISGHQDLINFAIMINDFENDNIVLNNSKYMLSDDLYNLNMFVPNNLIKNNDDILLFEIYDGDILACVLSSANFAKKLNYVGYALLYNDNK